MMDISMRIGGRGVSGVFDKQLVVIFGCLLACLLRARVI